MITAVVAVRAGSQRVKNKNIRKFANTNLLELKLNVLKKVNNLDKIIVNSDCDKMIEVALRHGVEAHKRQAYYASSEATNSEFHGHIGETTDSEVIFLAPVCSPFVSVQAHEKAIDYYYNNNFDSVTSVADVKNHLWLNGKPLNYDLRQVPNSQDLPDIVKLTYGITIVDRSVMRDESRVVGNNPGFYKLNDIESVDIDTEFDFLLAEMMHEKGLSDVGF